MTLAHRLIISLPFSDAQSAAVNLIDNIYELINDISTIRVGQGYDVLAKQLLQMKSEIQSATGPFLDKSVAEMFYKQFIITFTNIHPDITQNLKDFHEAFIDINDFFGKYPTSGDFKLLNFQNERVKQMMKITQISNKVFQALKTDSNNVISICALFAMHSSKTEMAEYALLKELKNYAQLMKKNKETPKFDPVKIFSVNNQISSQRHGYITEARAIRNLLDHHKYDLHFDSTPLTISFQSQAGSDWDFSYNRTFTGEEFRNWAATIDLMYKCMVNMLWCNLLLAVFRAHFVK